MKTEIPCSITVDTNWNRYYSQAYKPAPMPKWVEWASVMPMVMVKSEDVHQAIEAYRAGNQQLVNDILSRYY